MRILQLAARLPYPLTDGGAIGIYKITESVAALGHEVTLLTYPDPDPQVTAAAREAMSAFCDLRLVAKPLPSRFVTILRTLLRGAYPVERREMRAMYDLIDSTIAERTFDVVHCDHSHMVNYGVYIKERYKLPVLLRQHNVEAQIYERFARHASNPLARWFGVTQSKRLSAEEQRFVRAAGIVAAISEEDAAIMRAYAPNARIRVVPAGVDLDAFAPIRGKEQADNITWVGRFAWEPNADAVRYFLSEIFPLVVRQHPTSVFHIVGAGGEALTAAAKPFGPNVVIHGFVDDLRDVLARAAVLVVPLRIGGGMRIKILEFCAAGKAVVSTRIGAEGNVAVNDRDILLRDDPASFADAVVKVLTDERLRTTLGANARTLAERTYSWARIGQMFCELYEELRTQTVTDH